MDEETKTPEVGSTEWWKQRGRYERQGRPKGSTDSKPRGGRKLDADKVRHIRKLYRESTTKSYTEIQAVYPNVTRQNIEQIVNYKIWKGVKDLPEETEVESTV